MFGQFAQAESSPCKTFQLKILFQWRKKIGQIKNFALPPQS